MEKMNALTLIITLVVGVILTGALLGPVLNDATATEKTFDNSPYAFYQMKELETGDLWERSNGVWTANGETLTNSNSGSVSIIATNNVVVRQDGSLRGAYANNTVTSAEIVSLTDVDTLQINSSTNVTYTEGYGATTDGEYILKTYEDSAYVHEDTNLWVSGVTALGQYSSSLVFVHIDGSIKDGVTVSAVAATGGTATDITTTDVAINYEAVNGYIDLYKITSVTFKLNATYGDESVTVDATYSTFVLPKEVTAELSQHLTPGQIALMDAIPVMVIVALLMVAVGAIALRRAD